MIASMFSAILFTRTAFRWMMTKGGLKRLTMANLAPKKEFQFLKHRVIAVGLSLAVLVGSMAVFAKRGANNFGIDFRGGDLLVLDVKPTMKIAEARQALLPLGLGDNIRCNMNKLEKSNFSPFVVPKTLLSKFSKRCARVFVIERSCLNNKKKWEDKLDWSSHAKRSSLLVSEC